jgi:oligoribonuclease NrnB/cAMP/cGMP phosphodiesterase (DHH superfamily)
MKILFIYHDPCTDGFLARIIAECYYSTSEQKNQVTYVGVNPSTLSADLERCLGDNKDNFDQILMFDVSLSPEHLDKLLSASKNVKIFDHHESTEKAFAGTINVSNIITFDNTKCGAHLAFSYFYPGLPLPTVVKYVEVRDLWLFGKPRDLPNSKAITTYLYEVPFLIPFKDASNYFHMILNSNSCNWDNIIQEGNRMLREVDLAAEQIVNRMVAVNLNLNLNPNPTQNPNNNNLKVLVVETDKYVSEAGNMAIKKYPDVDFILMWSLDAKKNIKISLRSDASHCNVNNIARQLWGGGGHAAAAGALISDETKKNEFSKVFLGV